jgi:WD40 repeat protein
VQPVLNAGCVACHKPEKKKGKLDLTTYAGLSAGGENGRVVVPGRAKESGLVESIIPHGDEPPTMPEKGEPLAKADVDLIARWVEQGAKDDTPAAAAAAKAGYAQPGPTPPAEPPAYRVAPVIGAMAASPDGKLLAVAGRQEVLLLATDDWGLTARLPFAAPRITSVLFSADGSKLYAAGGAPGQFGHLQAWDVESRELRHNWRATNDTLFGLAVSPDGERASFGGADRSVRLLALADGKELLNAQGHTDWVFGTAFAENGSKLVTTGRDKALKLVYLPGGQPTIDVAEPQEPAGCLAVSPAGKVAVVGAANGEPRLYRVTDPVMRTEKQKDPNFVKGCEKVRGPVNAVAFSPDGEWFAAAGTNEAKVYRKTGDRTATLAGHAGPVYAVAFSPDGKRVYTAGFDAKVRVFEATGGKLVREVVPGPWANKAR